MPKSSFTYTKDNFTKLQNHLKAAERKAQRSGKVLSFADQNAAEFESYVTEGLKAKWLEIREGSQEKHDAKKFKYAGGVSGKDAKTQTRIVRVIQESNGEEREVPANEAYLSDLMKDAIRMKKLEESAAQSGIEAQYRTVIKMIDIIREVLLTASGAHEHLALEQNSPQAIEERHEMDRLLDKYRGKLQTKTSDRSVTTKKNTLEAAETAPTKEAIKQSKKRHFDPQELASSTPTVSHSTTITPPNGVSAIELANYMKSNPGTTTFPATWPKNDEGKIILRAEEKLAELKEISKDETVYKNIPGVFLEDITGTLNLSDFAFPKDFPLVIGNCTISNLTLSGSDLPSEVIAYQSKIGELKVENGQLSTLAIEDGTEVGKLVLSNATVNGFYSGKSLGFKTNNQNPLMIRMDGGNDYNKLTPKIQEILADSNSAIGFPVDGRPYFEGPGFPKDLKVFVSGRPEKKIVIGEQMTYDNLRTLISELGGNQNDQRLAQTTLLKDTNKPKPDLVVQNNCDSPEVRQEMSEAISYYLGENRDNIDFNTFVSDTNQSATIDTFQNFFDNAGIDLSVVASNTNPDVTPITIHVCSFNLTALANHLEIQRSKDDFTAESLVKGGYDFSNCLLLFNEGYGSSLNGVITIPRYQNGNLTNVTVPIDSAVEKALAGCFGIDADDNYQQKLPEKLIAAKIGDLTMTIKQTQSQSISPNSISKSLSDEVTFTPGSETRSPSDEKTASRSETLTPGSETESGSQERSKTSSVSLSEVSLTQIPSQTSTIIASDTSTLSKKNTGSLSETLTPGSGTKTQSEKNTITTTITWSPISGSKTASWSLTFQSSSKTESSSLFTGTPSISTTKLVVPKPNNTKPEQTSVPNSSTPKQTLEPATTVVQTNTQNVASSNAPTQSTPLTTTTPTSIPQETAKPTIPSTTQDNSNKDNSNTNKIITATMVSLGIACCIAASVFGVILGVKKYRVEKHKKPQAIRSRTSTAIEGEDMNEINNTPRRPDSLGDDRTEDANEGPSSITTSPQEAGQLASKNQQNTP